MRWKEIITENADSVFYHGTANEKAAMAILEHGINPPDLTNTKNHMLRPVIGRVYVTPLISYAQVYAIGGYYAGHETYRVPYEGNEEKFKHIWGGSERHESRHGYVFVIPAEVMTGDQQPDEDEVGQLYAYYLSGGPSKYAEEEDAAKYEKLKAMGGIFFTFVSVMNSVVSDAARKRIMQGEYAYYARAGKTALNNKRFTPELKKALIDAGCHVAHAGAIIPTQCWKIDKAKIGWLEKNGSNFFEIAERIR